MQRAAFCIQLMFTLLLLGSNSGVAQMQILELVNPDGSVPNNVKAVAILPLSVTLDEHLTALHTSDRDRQSKPYVASLVDLGKLSVPVEAKTVIAQNEHGFVFVPPGTMPGKVKLRAWAKLKIDTATVPQSVRDKYQIQILWQNNFAGLLPDYIIQAGLQVENPFGGPGMNDPFGTGPATPPDWRFHPYVTRSQVVEVVDQTISVPPGEVTILMNLPGAESATSPSVPMVTLGIVRTVSDQTVEFKLPQLSTAQGRLTEEANLPDWAQGNDPTTRVMAMPIGASAMSVPSPSELLASQRNMPKFKEDPFGGGAIAPQAMLADASARYFASAAGSKVRTSIVGNAVVPTDEHGRFNFDVLPVGKYKLFVARLISTNGTLGKFEVAQGLNVPGGETSEAMTFEIEANAHVDLGDVSRQVKRAETKVATLRDANSRFEPDAKAETVTISPTNPKEVATIANARIAAALDRVVEDVEYNAMPLQHVLDTLSDGQNIPILMSVTEADKLGIAIDAPITLSLPPITLRSLLNHVLAQFDGDLTFVVRDEVLLITSRDDAAEHPGVTLDVTTGLPAFSPSGTAPAVAGVTGEIIERWLKSAPQNADRTELKQLLESQLSAEFDAAQQTRRAEIDRLQELLEKSRTWLDQRQQRRQEIIQQRLQELLGRANLKS